MKKREWDGKHTSSYLRVRKLNGEWVVWLNLITMTGSVWTKIYTHNKWKWALHHALQIIHCTEGRTSDMPFEYHYNGWYGNVTDRSDNVLSSDQTA